MDKLIRLEAFEPEKKKRERAKTGNMAKYKHAVFQNKKKAKKQK